MASIKVQAKPGLAAYVLRGTIGGIVGGAVFIGVTMWFSAKQRNPPAAPFGLISSIVLQPLMRCLATLVISSAGQGSVLLRTTW